MAVLIRFARASETERLVELWWQLHLHHTNELGAASDYDYVDDVLESMQKHFRNTQIPKKHILVAEEKKQIVGFCEFEEDRRPRIYKHPRILKIWCIYVLPGHRKKGIGTKLIGHVDKIRKQKKIKAVELNAHVKNKEAKAFYRKKGFHENKVTFVKA